MPYNSDEAERLIARYVTRERIERHALERPVLTVGGMAALLGFAYWAIGQTFGPFSTYDHAHGLTSDPNVQQILFFREYVFPVVAAFMVLLFLATIPATRGLRRWDSLVADGKIIQVDEIPFDDNYSGLLGPFSDDPPPRHESRFCSEGSWFGSDCGESLVVSAFTGGAMRRPLLCSHSNRLRRGVREH